MSALRGAPAGRTSRWERRARGEGSGAPWWLNPAAVVLLVVPPTLYVAVRLTDADYRDQFREPKLLTTSTAELVLTAALVLAATAAVVAELPSRRPSTLIDDGELAPTLRRCASVLFWVTIGGYAAFVGSGVLHGASLGQVVGSLVHQDNYAGTFKSEFVTVPGLTTLTQVGIAFEIVALHAHRLTRDRRLIGQIVVVFVLATLRAFLNTERLAIIELAAPLVAHLGVAGVRSARPAARRVVRVMPVAFLPVLLVVFAGFEYSRSWQFFKTRTHLEFWHFMLLRLGGYYATSYNNGQVLLEHGRWPGRLPYDTFEAFWTAPGIGTLDLYDRFSAPVPQYAQDLLGKYLSPEFNNPGGITDPFVDLGTFGGFCFFVVAGIVVGLLYRSLRARGITGSLLYPVALTGLSDLPRELYWTLGRTVPALVALVVVALVLRARGRSTARAEVREDRIRRRSARMPAHAASAGEPELVAVGAPLGPGAAAPAPPPRRALRRGRGAGW